MYAYVGHCYLSPSSTRITQEDGGMWTHFNAIQGFHTTKSTLGDEMEVGSSDSTCWSTYGLQNQHMDRILTISQMRLEQKTHTGHIINIWTHTSYCMSNARSVGLYHHKLQHSKPHTSRIMHIPHTSDCPSRYGIC